MDEMRVCLRMLSLFIYSDLIQCRSFPSFVTFREKMKNTVLSDKISNKTLKNPINILILHIFCNLELAKMADIIKHRGIVENINGSHIQVRIVQTSACSACSIKGHCNASESKDKLIDIFNNDSSSYQKGQEVMVYGTSSMGMKAVLLAFGLPFIILFVSLYITMKLTNDELYSALGGLSALIPYYFIIYICRGKISRKFLFTIEPININY